MGYVRCDLALGQRAHRVSPDGRDRLHRPCNLVRIRGGMAHAAALHEVQEKFEEVM